MTVDLSPQPHEEAIALIQGKPVVTREVFDGLLPELRGRAFTITGVTAADVMERVRDGLAALPRGTVWDDAKADIATELDPWLGDGAEQRAELLLRTHGFQAFQAANWRVAQEDDDTTHLQYLATEDDRVRATHLALNGVTLPKDDPFWQKHYPPWEWGCRCRVRPMNPDLVAEARAADEKRPPDDKLVIEGPARRKLEEGTLIRDGQVFNVTAPSDTNKENAFQWHPDDLRLPLAELKARYDAPSWSVFENFAKGTAAATGVSVWDWLSGEALQPLPEGAKAVGAYWQFGSADDAIKWADANLHPNGLSLTKAERAALADYQEGSYSLNRQLYDAQPLNAERRAQVELLDAAVDKSQLDHGIIVYRGLKAHHVAQWKEGEVIQKGYMSTSLSAGKANEFNQGALIKIRVPKGASALYMDAISGGYGQEAEIVLPRGSKLRLLSVRKSEKLIEIEAELIL